MHMRIGMVFGENGLYVDLNISLSLCMGTSNHIQASFEVLFFGYYIIIPFMWHPILWAKCNASNKTLHGLFYTLGSKSVS
jgi:hypothetical protein